MFKTVPDEQRQVIQRLRSLAVILAVLYISDNPLLQIIVVVVIITTIVVIITTIVGVVTTTNFTLSLDKD